MKTILVAGFMILCSGHALAAPTNEITLRGMGSPHYFKTSITGAPKPVYKAPKYKVSSTITARKYSAGKRPGKWCGWWMRTQFGGGPEYNLARNWAKRGSSAGGPQVGAVVVWRNHVGIITGRASNGKWIVKSGNDGGKVRERARSLSGAIGFRIV